MREVKAKVSIRELLDGQYADELARSEVFHGECPVAAIASADALDGKPSFTVETDDGETEWIPVEDENAKTFDVMGRA